MTAILLSNLLDSKIYLVSNFFTVWVDARVQKKFFATVLLTI